MAISTYAVAVGGNRRGRHGTPHEEGRAALALLGGRASAILDTPPLGPSIRRFANAVTIIASAEAPDALLARLKKVERSFGRRAGRRWGARVIDLDIVLWSGGRVATRTLTVPHRAFRSRGFVLAPLMAVAPGWRDPVTGLRVRHLHARLTRARAINRPRGSW